MSTDHKTPDPLTPIRAFPEALEQLGAVWESGEARREAAAKLRANGITEGSWARSQLMSSRKWSFI